MKQSTIGLILMVSSFTIWLLATRLFFEVNVFVPIWIIDPVRFMLISVPAALVFFVGALAVFGDMLSEDIEVVSEPHDNKLLCSTLMSPLFIGVTQSEARLLSTIIGMESLPKI